MKVMVTGGSGFIGGHIVEHFYKDAEVVVVDNLRSGFKKNIEPFIKEGNVKFVKGSITNGKLLKKHMKGVDYVFHLAALISVPESMYKPFLTEEINTLGTLNVLEAAKENGVKKVVLSSSAAVYGDNPVMPKVETMTPEPKSPYAITKLAGEYYFKMYREFFKTPTAVMRYFNVFGPRQDPKSQYAAAVPIFISKAVRNEDITIFGDGEQTRDFVFVKEVVKANVLAAEKGDSVYNVALGGKITIKELAQKIINILGSKSQIIHKDERPGDIKHSRASIDNIKSIGFTPDYEFDKALEITINYFKDLYSK